MRLLRRPTWWGTPAGSLDPLQESEIQRLRREARRGSDFVLAFVLAAVFALVLALTDPVWLVVAIPLVIAQHVARAWRRTLLSQRNEARAALVTELAQATQGTQDLLTERQRREEAETLKQGLAAKLEQTESRYAESRQLQRDLVRLLLRGYTELPPLIASRDPHGRVGTSCRVVLQDWVSEVSEVLTNGGQSELALEIQFDFTDTLDTREGVQAALERRLRLLTPPPELMTGERPR